MDNNQRTYEPPMLTVAGKVDDLTQQQIVGNNLDAAFDAGTPLNQLTVS